MHTFVRKVEYVSIVTCRHYEPVPSSLYLSLGLSLSPFFSLHSNKLPLSYTVKLQATPYSWSVPAYVEQDKSETIKGKKAAYLWQEKALWHICIPLSCSAVYFLSSSFLVWGGDLGHL